MEQEKLSPYKNIPSDVMDRIIDKVLGTYIYEELEDASHFYREILAPLDPIEVHNSLHIYEEVHEVLGVQYQSLFAIGTNWPFQVNIRTLREKKWVQLELFDDQ